MQRAHTGHGKLDAAVKCTDTRSANHYSRLFHPSPPCTGTRLPVQAIFLGGTTLAHSSGRGWGIKQAGTTPVQGVDRRANACHTQGSLPRPVRDASTYRAMDLWRHESIKRGLDYDDWLDRSGWSKAKRTPDSRSMISTDIRQ